MDLVTCPICNKRMTMGLVNLHLDKGCKSAIPPSKEPSSSPLNDPENPKQPEDSNEKAANNNMNPFSQRQKSSGMMNQNSLKRTVPDQPSLKEDERPRKSRNLKRDASKPLAELIRPRTLDEYIGQEDLVGPNGILRAFIQRDTCPSIILWGPSGVR